MKIASIILIVAGLFFAVITFSESFTPTDKKGTAGDYHKRENVVHTMSPIMASFLLPAGVALLWASYRRNKKES